jgi:uncharacterized membrane protein
MTHQQAVSVVAAPLDAVERRLRDVGHWPQFLLGLEEVAETSFGRYTFLLRDRSSVREVEVAVVAHPGEHRIVWHALAGPRFDGEVRLAAVDARHTRVSLTLTAEPAGFLASLGDLAHMGHHSTAVLDLQRLEALVTGAANAS